MKKFIILLANSQHYVVHALRIAIFIAVALIGGFKALSHPGHQLSYLVGAVSIIAGTMTLLGIWMYKTGLIGGLLIVLSSLVALVVLSIGLGVEVNAQHQALHHLSGVGRLLVLMIAGMICASDCAKQIFRDYVLRMGKA